MRTLTIMIGLLMIVPTLSGCFAGEKIENIEESGPFSFEEGEISMTTWYHYPGTVSNPSAVDATNPDAVLGANLSVNLSGDNPILRIRDLLWDRLGYLRAYSRHYFFWSYIFYKL